MDSILRTLGLTENEIKVYKALLRLKKGTKTPIVKEARVLSSKVYEILDRLIQRGLVSFLIEDNVKQFIPVHPENVKDLFDLKIKELEKQKNEMQAALERFPKSDFSTEAQIFHGWNGLRSALNIALNDIGRNGAYHLLGATPGEDIQKAFEFFSDIDNKFSRLNIQYRMIHPTSMRVQSKEFRQISPQKNWDVRYYDLTGPFEIGISKSYILLILMESEPLVIMIHSQKMRDSFMQYFNIIWALSKK